jgi:hypothetical protein
MGGDPGIRRLTLIPASGPTDEIRRYRLAHLDEIALAWPPDQPEGFTERDRERREPGDEAPPEPGS